MPPQQDHQHSVQETPTNDENKDSLNINTSAANTTDASSSSENDESITTATATFSYHWTNFILVHFHAPIRRFLQWLTHYAAVHPLTMLLGIPLASFALAGIGLATNFHLEDDIVRLWTPQHATVVQHKEWMDTVFPVEPRILALLFHNADGSNLLQSSSDNSPTATNTLQYVQQAIDAVRSLPGYDSVCAESDYVDWETNTHTCEIYGPSKFWNHDASTLNSWNHNETIQHISELEFPDRMPIVQGKLYGFPVRENDQEDGLLVSVQSFWTYIFLPPSAEDFEEDALEAIWNLPNQKLLQVQVRAERSFADEFTRAIVVDIPLVPVVFIVMVAFMCAYFFRWRNPVESRCALGLGAVVAVLLSIVSAYGLMFIVGVPFTSMTQLLPFILFGIGLDDAFIIMGSFRRTDPDKDTVERIQETIEDVGVSITLTSITSTLAFCLGCLSSIPAVDWLCMYAFPSVIFVFLYQITFFVACIVLDEKRIQERRRDVCCCRTVVADDDDDDDDDKGQSGEPSTVDKFMAAYAEFLLRPWVKLVVVIGFGVLAVFCAMSASELRQEFEFTDVLPRDSYLTDFVEGREKYSTRKEMDMQVVFRHVNQSDPVIQQQMRDYVNDIVEMDAVVTEPSFFWLDDVERYANFSNIQDLDFNEKVDRFLSVPIINEVYGNSIVRDDEGNVIASRTVVSLDNVDWENVQNQIDTYDEIHRVNGDQPVNRGITGEEDFSFFGYTFRFNIWEFYSRTVDELTSSAVIGVSAVSLIALLLIPHWSAAPIILPMMCVLYIDLLGVMQWGGVTINAVSWVSLAMSVGLLVDFLMHVLLRYYESKGSRHEKTVEMLTTMGSSILVGGISTFLGTVPLAFSQSQIFYTVFIAFLGLVTLGVSHGLILLPVILSTIGTEDYVPHHSTGQDAGVKDDEKNQCATPRTVADEEDPGAEIEV